MTFSYNSGLFKTLLKYLRPKENETILDLGCNRGYYLKRLENYTKQVVGVDISEEAIKEAVSPKVILGNATNLDFQTGTFDKIYSLHTIEHVADLRRFLREAGRVLKPGGIFVLIYPWELIRGIQAILAAVRNYKNPFMAKKIHLHKLTPEKIESLLKDTPLVHVQSRLIFTQGVHYLTVLKKDVQHGMLSTHINAPRVNVASKCLLQNLFFSLKILLAP